jgi:hypothetical protein
MIRTFVNRWRDERGIALITALLVSMVVVTLGIASVTLAIHNSESSAFDRRRVQGVAAAEAGLNWYYSHLQSVTADQFECSATQTLTTSPTAQFSATVTFFDEAGTEMPCPLAEDDEPAGASIVSEGRSTRTATPTRTMESYVNLIPIPGGPFAETAIFSDDAPGFDSNIQVFGDGTLNGDVYTNGDALFNSNSVIHGSIYIQGNVELDSNAEIKRDVYANGSVKLKSNARVLGNATSSTSWISLDSQAHVYGDARAGTTITTLGSSQIDGLEIPNSPSPPPEYREFPTYSFDSSDWTEKGYQVQTFSDCALAKAFIEVIPAGDWVVRITSSCDLSWTSNNVINVSGNLAIVSDGSLTMDSNAHFQSDGSPHTLHLIFGLGGVSPCDIVFRSNTYISSGITTLLYTPCVLELSSNSFVAEGQMFGGFVDFNSNANLTYRPVDVPGTGSGLFDEDIVYIREVVTQ